MSNMESAELRRKRKIDEIHNGLKTTLACDYLDKSINSGNHAKRFRLGARIYLTSKSDRAKRDPIKVLDKLEERGHISPGSYEKLTKLVAPIDVAMVYLIKEKEREILKIGDGAVKNHRPFSRIEENVLENTSLEITEHESDKTFVTLPVVKEAEEILEKHKLLVLVGRRGSGKTKCALEILSKKRKAEKKKVNEREGENGKEEKPCTLPIFKLSDVTKWSDTINGNDECYVWFDDLFEGNKGNIIEQNKSHFETIKAVSRQGAVKVIFTITSTSYALYRNAIDTIIGSEYVKNLDSKEYQLTREMKLQIIKSHLMMNNIAIRSDEELTKERYNHGHVIATATRPISESEVDKILICDPYVGFPLCCFLFASNVEYFAQGAAFFNSPTQELVNSIERLRLSDVRSDQQQYMALCYVIFNENSINLNEVNESLTRNLFALLRMEKVDSCEGSIRRGAEILKRNFFLRESSHNTQILELQQSCIMKATMISFSRISVDAFMKVFNNMSTVMLNETIKLTGKNCSHDDMVIPYRIYDEVGENLLMRLQNGDYAALSIPIWDDEKFINQVFQTRRNIEWIIKSGFPFSCRYGKMLLAKMLIVTMLADKELSSDEKRRQQILGLKEACVQGFRNIVELVVTSVHLSAEDVIDISRCIRYNTTLCIFLLDQLDKSAFDEQALKKFLEIFVRDQSLEVVMYIMQKCNPASEIHIQTAANIAGRVGSISCVYWLIETYDFLKSAVIEEALKGSCLSGCISVLNHLIEHFHDEVVKHGFECLQIASSEGLPDIVDILLEIKPDVSKLQIGDLLNNACSRGLPLVVKVLVDKNDCLTTPDISNAIDIALKYDKMNVVNVIKETYPRARN